MTALVVAAALVASSAPAWATNSSAAAQAPTVGDPQSGSDMPAVTPATFSNPPLTTRPMYRWWLPMAEVEAPLLASQLAAVSEAGGGGVEIQPFGSDVSPVTLKYGIPNFKRNAAYLETRGWGTPAWAQAQATATKLGVEAGLQVDTMNTPGWPPSLPSLSDFNDPATQQKIVSSQTQVAAGAGVTRPVPVAGTFDDYDSYATIPERANSIPTRTTTICPGAAGGSTNLKIANDASFGAGSELTIGQGATQERAVVKSVGSTSMCSALAVGATAGASRVFVESLGDRWEVGQKLTIGGQEVTVTDVVASSNAASSAPTTLSAATMVGATNVKLATVTAPGRFPNGDFVYNIGDTIRIDGEFRTIVGPKSPVGLFNGTAGPTGTGVELDKPLQSAHAAGAPAQKTGLGVAFTPALQADSPAGTPIARVGSGVELTAPLSFDHASGSTVVNTAKSTLRTVLLAQCATSNCPATGATRVLDPASVKDVTAAVSGGSITVDVPAGNGNPWWIIAYYTTSTGASYSNATMPEGTYNPDHLSRAGVKAITDYWEKNILTPGLRASLKAQADAGNPAAFFEDSLEVAKGMLWTPEFATRFEALNGYDISTKLPAIFNAAASEVDAGFFEFGDGVGQRLRQDYLDTWNDLYAKEYLLPIQKWANDNHMKLRFQSYANPVPGGLDVPYTNSLIDIPETESLNMARDPERHKLVSVGAHLRGGTAVTCECSALSTGGWGTTAAGVTGGNLAPMYEAFAGGATRMIYHGLPYVKTPEGSGTSSRWPGTSGFGTTITENWGPVMPQWTDKRQINDATARFGLVLRQGTPHFDVAVLREDTNTFLAPLTTSSAMAQNGYSYEYLSARNLLDEAATLKDGVLFPEHSAYRALVLNNQVTFRPAVAAKIADLAEAGFPVVVIGAADASKVRAVGYSPGDDAAVRAAMSRVYALIDVTNKAVRRVDAESAVPGALASVQVGASAAKATPADNVLSVRRTSPDADYYYVYNKTANAVSTTLTLKGDGVPYHLDPWTGKITQISQYTSVADGVTVNVDLAARDAGLYAVSTRNLTGGATAATAVVSTTAARVVSDAGDLRLQVTQAGPVKAALSNGEEFEALVDKVTPVPRLLDWTLAATSWENDETGLAGVEHTIHRDLGTRPISAGSDGTLPTWGAIDGLQRKSGQGVYSTQFELPQNWSAQDGAYLALGSAVDTVRLDVNGTKIPVNQANLRRIDVGPHLRAGTNSISVTVSTPLRNAVTVARGLTTALAADYGLRGPVVLTPYRSVAVDDSIIDVAITTEPRVLGGKVYLSVAVTNKEAVAVDVVVSSEFGKKSFMKVAPGKTVSVALNTRSVSVPAGTIVVDVSALINGKQVVETKSAAYGAYPAS